MPPRDADAPSGLSGRATAASAAALSCFIIARDEADGLAAVIDRVIGWVDEVVVVDSGSADGTPQIAARLGARVIHHDWAGYGPQKRFAEAQCRNDWLLNLDADEVPDDALCREIAALFADATPPHPFYQFRVRIVYPGEAAPRRWAPHNSVVRLYDRRQGRYSDSLVHDRVDTGGVRARRLAGEAAHHSYRSLGFLVDKLNAYGDLQAAAGRRRARMALLARLPFEFPLAFVKYYIARRHFVAGAKGFVFALTNAFFRFLRLAKRLERA